MSKFRKMSPYEIMAILHIKIRQFSPNISLEIITLNLVILDKDRIVNFECQSLVVT